MAAAKKRDELKAMADAKAKQSDRAAAAAEMATPASTADVQLTEDDAATDALAKKTAAQAVAAATTSVDDDAVLVEPPPKVEAEAAEGDFLLVTERLWKFVVIRHVDEASALNHAARFWSCWVLFRKDANGVYEEVCVGGKTAALTMGMPHKSIRAYVAANFGELDSMARRPSVAQPE